MAHSSRMSPGMPDAHLQHEHLMFGAELLVDHLADAHRRIVGARRGQHLVAQAQDFGDDEFRAGFAVGAGDPDDGQIRVCGQLAAGSALEAFLDGAFDGPEQPAGQQHPERRTEIGHEPAAQVIQPSKGVFGPTQQTTRDGSGQREQRRHAQQATHAGRKRQRLFGAIAAIAARRSEGHAPAEQHQSGRPERSQQRHRQRARRQKQCARQMRTAQQHVGVRAQPVHEAGRLVAFELEQVQKEQQATRGAPPGKQRGQQSKQPEHRAAIRKTGAQDTDAQGAMKRQSCLTRWVHGSLYDSPKS